MINSQPLHLFEGFGVELEYMIVHNDTLNVFPIADELLRSAAGEYTNDVERGPVCWSNELVTHLIELKTNGPAKDLRTVSSAISKEIGEINTILQDFDARLLPSAMHPWMDPYTETKLWPHDYNAIYETYNRIFDCRGHGWSNLQSVHLNLPFGDDNEFGRLHAAIRLLLPILPAVAASSPIFEGRFNNTMDNRMAFYRTNSARIPSLTGKVIPEPVFSRQAYDEQIFQPMYRDIAPHDPDEIMRDEWLNARGAIARFDRDAIEIRVLDIQENPHADLAILLAAVFVLQKWAEEEWCSYTRQKEWTVESLEPILLDTISAAESAKISNSDYLRLFRYPSSSATAGELWNYIFNSMNIDSTIPAGMQQFYDAYQKQGSLARRILKRVNGRFGRLFLEKVYGELADCLQHGHIFTA